MKKIGNKGSIIITALIGVPASFFMVISTVALVSLNSARMKANDAGFQSTTLSYVTDMVMCCDEEGGRIQSEVGEDICSVGSDYGQDIYSSAMIGSVKVIKNCNGGEFEIELTPSNNINTNISKAICTQNGCEFE